MGNFKVLKVGVYGSLGTLVFVFGCSTPTQQISQFGAACGSIGSDSQKAYVLLDQSIQKRQIYNAALNPHVPITPAIFDGVMQERQRLEIRTRLLSELGDYAQALQQLATKDFRTGIDASSKDLAGAMKSLRDTYDKDQGAGSLNVSDNDIYILATVVDEAASTYVEWKRRKAIKTIVENTDPAIQKVTRLLASEFQSIGPVVGSQLNQAETFYEKAYNNDAPNMLYEARIQMLQNIQITHDNYDACGGLFDSLVGAVSKIGATHADIKKALENNDWNAKNMIADIQELSAQAKSVKAFYQSLK